MFIEHVKGNLIFVEQQFSMKGCFANFNQLATMRTMASMIVASKVGGGPSGITVLTLSSIPGRIGLAPASGGVGEPHPIKMAAAIRLVIVQEKKFFIAELSWF